LRVLSLDYAKVDAVKTVRLLAIACAAFALVLACLAGDPQSSRVFGDEGDESALSLDISDSLPATFSEPLVVPPKSGLVFVDHQPPPSCLTTAEVFRPPRP
jgi:hypothetical protein